MADYFPNKKGIVTVNKMGEGGGVDLSSLNSKKIKSVIINGDNNDNAIIGSKYNDTIKTEEGKDFVIAYLKLSLNKFILGINISLRLCVTNVIKTYPF